MVDGWVKADSVTNDRLGISSMQWPSESYEHERLAIKDSLFASRILRPFRARLLPAHGSLSSASLRSLPIALFTGKCFAFTTFTPVGLLRSGLRPLAQYAW